MKTVQHTVHVARPAREVFDFVMDTQHLPEWIPSMDEVHDIRGSGKGKSYDWTYRMAGVRLKGHSEVTDVQAPTSLETRSTTGVHSTWRYRFEDKDGGCQLTLRVDYEVPSPVLGRLAENLVHGRNQRELELGLANLKDLLEHQRTAAPA